MYKKVISILLIILTLILSSCGSYSDMDVQTSTSDGVGNESTLEAGQTSEEDTVAYEKDTAASTEQTQAPELNYQVVLGFAAEFKDSGKNFALFTSREDVDKLEGVDPQLYEKYNDDWFKTHSFILVTMGHGSCCYADLCRIEQVGNDLIISVNKVDKDQDDYQERGKEYEDPEFRGTHTHSADYCVSNFFIEFDQSGEEMLQWLETVTYRFRDYPSSWWRETELSLKEPEHPPLNLTAIPFLAQYVKAEKEKYVEYEEHKTTYEKWGNKVVTAPQSKSRVPCISLTQSGGADALWEELDAEMGARPIIYAMIGLNQSYQCEVYNVSISTGNKLMIYMYAEHGNWDKLTEAEQDAITRGESACGIGSDTHKYEIFLGIDSEYGSEYVELMKTLDGCVLVVTDKHNKQRTKIEVEYFTTLIEP